MIEEEELHKIIGIYMMQAVVEGFATMALMWGNNETPEDAEKMLVPICKKHIDQCIKELQERGVVKRGWMRLK